MFRHFPFSADIHNNFANFKEGTLKTSTAGGEYSSPMLIECPRTEEKLPAIFMTEKIPKVIQRPQCPFAKVAIKERPLPLPFALPFPFPRRRESFKHLA